MDDLQKLISAAEKSVTESKKERDTTLKLSLDASTLSQIEEIEKNAHEEEIISEWDSWEKENLEIDKSGNPKTKKISNIAIATISIAVLILMAFLLFSSKEESKGISSKSFVAGAGPRLKATKDKLIVDGQVYFDVKPGVATHKGMPSYIENSSTKEIRKKHLKSIKEESNKDNDSNIENIPKTPEVNHEKDRETVKGRSLIVNGTPVQER